jgi:MFS family permease/flagellar motor switch/type III secretory pathway protein FliN
MATWAEIRGDRISFLRTIVGFLPLALGCFLAVLFHRIDAIVADEVMTDLALGEGTAGILTAAFLLAFAASLLPSGIAIDRFGPRTVQSVMMGVAAFAALICSLSTGPFSLAAGRILLGVSTASALLAGMKAVVTWFPRGRLGLAMGCLLAAAGLGALAAAGPAATFMRSYGWGSLFILLAFLAMICAILTALLVPTPATATGEAPDEDHGLLFVLRDPIFRRFAPFAAVAVGTVWAIQSQWLVGWLVARNGLEITDIVSRLTLITVGQTAGSLVWGAVADWSVRKSLSATSLFVGAVALSVCMQLAAVVGIVSPTSFIWNAFLVAGATAVLPFVVLSAHFPPAYAARACASLSVLQYVAALVIQSAMGLVVSIWPHAASGETTATAYAMAFMVPVALQCAALAWFLFARSETRDGAQTIDEIAVAFGSLRSTAEPLLRNLTQRRSAAPAHQVEGPSEPTPLPGLPPVDAAAVPAEPAVEPVETVEAPTETPATSDDLAAEPADVAPDEAAPQPVAAASTPPETADETAEAASAPDEPADVEPADNAAEPTDTELAPTETADEAAAAASAEAETAGELTDAPTEPDSPAGEPVESASVPAEAVAPPAEPAARPTDAALQSMLGASLSAVLGGLDTTARARADTSTPAAPDPTAEIAQHTEREPSFPLIAPSHVQALNAVYRRRSALAATIGGRQISIAATWPPPDRRPDVSHRLALRVDGEPGELLLPQSLLDVLVGSVDPALSLDRLGPDRAAMILEFALDSALGAVEMDLGCRIAVESFSGKIERLESDEQLPLFFTLVIEGLVTAGCELRIPPDYALRLADGLDRHAGISRSALDVPVPVCLRVAAANLAVGEIERLGPDDVVLVDATVQPGHAVIAVIGERLVAPVTLAPEGHRLAAQPIPGATSPWAWSMPTDAVAAWEADTESDNRPLRVLFEIGRFELPASKVKQLAPNAPLPLGPVQDQTVDIVVGGQRIGRGTLMQIGNRTGVRVTSVRERPRPTPGLKRAPAEEPR